MKRNNLKTKHCDVAYINLKYKKDINVLIKNAWISPTKIRLIKIKFKRATILCDENESLYKIKIYKNKKSSDQTKYNLIVPDIDLSEPLSNMVNYIYYAIKNNNNCYIKSGQ